MTDRLKSDKNDNAVRPALLGLLDYAEEKSLIEACDRTYCENRLLQMLQLDLPTGEDKTLRAELLSSKSAGILNAAFEAWIAGLDITYTEAGEIFRLDSGETN